MLALASVSDVRYIRKKRQPMPRFITDLTCIHCGATFPGANLATAEGTWMTCPACGPADGILDIGFDLDRVRRAWQSQPLESRPRTHWRYEELLPLEPGSVRHDWPVGFTPLIDSPRLAKRL